MAAYWFLFATPFLAFLQKRPRSRHQTIFWFVIIPVIAFAIGWRHQVGGDWGSYVNHFHRISQLSFIEAAQYGDPGYSLVNWFAAQLGGGVHFANLICGGIFAYGLGVFCSRLPQPWLAVMIAIPYLVIVVAMGYTRQSVAIALMMVAFVRIGERRVLSFFAYAILASLFHKSALAIIPLAALAVTQGRVVTLVVALGIIAAGYEFLLAERADTITRVYITDEYKAAEGGPVRVILNALPAIVFLMFNHRIALTPEARRLWKVLSFTALAAVPAVFVVATATDRLSLYLIPLQIFVLSRLHEIFGRRNGPPAVMLVVFLYAAVQFVWLHYAVNARSWLPYQFYPFMG